MARSRVSESGPARAWAEGWPDSDGWDELPWRRPRLCTDKWGIAEVSPEVARVLAADGSACLAARGAVHAFVVHSLKQIPIGFPTVALPRYVLGAFAYASYL